MYTHDCSPLINFKIKKHTLINSNFDGHLPKKITNILREIFEQNNKKLVMKMVSEYLKVQLLIQPDLEV